MPGTKRKFDEDTWLVTQSKKFKQGFSLNNVYETTLAYLRLGASNFFNSLIGGVESSPGTRSPEAAVDNNLVASNQDDNNISSCSYSMATGSVSEGRPSLSPAHSSSSSTGSSVGRANTSPQNSPPGSPLMRDVISDNELQAGSPQSLGLMMSAKPATVCQDCVRQSGGKTGGNEDSYGKCSFCDKLVCHLNSCRGCRSDFCGGCCIAMYDVSSEDAYECYNCL